MRRRTFLQKSAIGIGALAGLYGGVLKAEEAWTRENLLNYIYNAAAIAHETGVSIMRSMPLAFPHEQQVAAISDQYMFGTDLLVAPVVNEDTFRTVVFPSGVWTSLWDGKTVIGPARLKVDAPLDVIPVYLKPAASVPVQLSRELQFGKSMTGGRVDALVVTPPIEDANATMLNVRGEIATVTGHSSAGGCNWTLENLPALGYVLSYGSAFASNVRVNGTALPRVTGGDPRSTAIGWSVDPVGNRLVMCLPSRQVEQSAQITEIEVDFNPSGNGTT